MIVDNENPYRGLETSTEFGLVHDTTSHWIKELNLILLRGIGNDGTIHKPC